MSLSKLAKKTAQTAKNIGETLRAAFRGKITLVVSSEPIQRVQLSGLADETLQDLEHLQEYGFASHPPDGSEAVVIPLGGNTSHGVIVCSQHGSYRIKNLKPGETAIFNHEGAKIVIKQGKIIEADCDVYRVNCKQYEVNAATDAKFNAPLVETSAVLTKRAAALTPTATWWPAIYRCASIRIPTASAAKPHRRNRHRQVDLWQPSGCFFCACGIEARVLREAV